MKTISNEWVRIIMINLCVTMADYESIKAKFVNWARLLRRWLPLRGKLCFFVVLKRVEQSESENCDTGDK